MKDKPLLSFFVLTFAITWGLALLLLTFGEALARIFGPLSPQNPIFILAVFSPSISALIITGVTEGRDGLLRLLAKLVAWRVGLLYYLLVLLGLPLLGVLAGAINGSLQPFSLGAMLAFIIADPGPLGEELGWRGFALPRLLEKHSVLKAGLILGAIWGVWHLPAFAFSGLGQSSLALPIFLLAAVVLSVLATWLYRATSGSVLISILLHMMVNMSISVIAGSFNAYFAALTLVTLTVLLITTWLETRSTKVQTLNASTLNES